MPNMMMVVDSSLSVISSIDPRERQELALEAVFEITAGPLPQDRQLLGMTSSFLRPPVNGTGSSKPLPTHTNSHLISATGYTTAIFTKNSLTCQPGAQTRIVTEILGICWL